MNKTSFWLLSFILFLLNIGQGHSQCNDTTDATLEETTSWISQKLNLYGYRQLPPVNYKVSFNKSEMKIIEIGMDSNLEMKDTVSIVKIRLENLDLSKLYFREINKAKNRFAMTLVGKGNSMYYFSRAMGKLENVPYEIILNADAEENLPERLIRALKHGYCISGGSTDKKVQEKF